MKDFDEIQSDIDNEFDSFLKEALIVEGFPRKYFYWTSSFFKTEAGLSFNHFYLNDELKQELNESGANYFGSSLIYFEITKSSCRNNVSINNTAKLFNERSKIGQTNRYEYLREFVFWYLIDELLERKKKERTKLIQTKLNSKKIDFERIEHDIKLLTEIEPILRKNFLINYVDYLLSQNYQWKLEGYISFQSFNQYAEIISSLNNLSEDNNKLRSKINALYVNENYRNKIHFIYSKQGGAGKEELRELLDIMGSPKSGNLYRGQAVSTWKLDSSLTRDKRYIDNEDKMYYEILSLKPESFQNDQTVYERLITMQHYGMPTRLMDLTRNPLIAIYFACDNLEKNDKEKDGCVYTFCPNEAYPLLNFEDERLKSLKALYDVDYKNRDDTFLNGIYYIMGLAKNQRISNQSGDFVFVGKDKDNGQKLYNLPELTIVIDSDAKTVLLQQLETLNIHGGSVYPDLSHMSNYIKDRYKKNNLSSDIVTDKKEEFVNSRSDDSSIISFELKNESEKNSGVYISRSIEKKKLVNLVNTFDEYTFWTEKRTLELDSFAKTYNMKQKELKEFINKYYFTEKEPRRDEVEKVMIHRPSLEDRRTELLVMLEFIIELADKLKALE